MPTGSLAPAPVFTGWDDNGNPLSAGTLDTFEAGTSTPATTWTDVNLSVANTNPIVLNSAGRCVIFLNPGASYKFVLKNSAGVTIWTQDNIGAVPASATDLDVAGTAGQALAAGEGVWLADGSGGTTAGRWHLWDADTVASSTGAVTLGMVPAAIASGAVGSIRLIGRITGLASLTPGATYRISGTAGALTTSAPANDRIVGQADTTTSFVFTPWSPGPAASASAPGVVTTGAQTFAGAKTFQSAAIFSAGFTFASTNTLGNLIWARSTANFTKNANTTFGDVTGLAFAVEASSNYVFLFICHGVSSVAADYKFTLTGPAAPTAIRFALLGIDSSFGVSSVAAFGSSLLKQGQALDEGILIGGLLRNGTNAGTVQLQMAQNSSDATNSVIYAESTVLALKLT